MVDKAQWEAEQMSPSYLAWTNSIPTTVNLKKDED
jgi:hypothetical protein